MRTANPWIEARTSALRRALSGMATRRRGGAYGKRLARDLRLLEEDARFGRNHLAAFGYKDGGDGGGGVLTFLGVVRDEDSPFHGGAYLFALELGKDWPHRAPVLRALNENGRWKRDASVCINGVTLHHAEGHSSAIPLATLAASVITVFLDLHSTGMMGALDYATRKEAETAVREIAGGTFAAVRTFVRETERLDVWGPLGEDVRGECGKADGSAAKRPRVS